VRCAAAAAGLLGRKYICEMRQKAGPRATAMAGGGRGGAKAAPAPALGKGGKGHLHRWRPSFEAASRAGLIRRSTRRRLAFDGEWDTGEGIGEDCRRGVGGRAGSSSSKQTAAAAAVSKQASKQAAAAAARKWGMRDSVRMLKHFWFSFWDPKILTPKKSSGSEFLGGSRREATRHMSTSSCCRFWWAKRSARNHVMICARKRGLASRVER